jgi:hypothetical protein
MAAESNAIHRRDRLGDAATDTVERGKQQRDNQR